MELLSEQMVWKKLENNISKVKLSWNYNFLWHIFVGPCRHDLQIQNLNLYTIYFIKC